MNTQTINRWKENLEQLLQSGEGRNSSDLIKNICDLGRLMGDTVAETILDTHPDLFEYSTALTQANNQRIVTEEIKETRRLIQDARNRNVESFKDVASATGLVHYNRVSDMFDHIDFNDYRRLVIVGCGRLPSTSFHVHDKTEVPEIIGIDFLPEAIKTATELAAVLDYPRVKCELKDGSAYDYSQAQIVFVAHMVSPKSAVLSRIADTANKDVQIVVREPFSLGRLWAESCTRPLDQRLQIVSCGSSGHWNLTQDIYLRLRTRSTI